MKVGGQDDSRSPSRRVSGQDDSTSRLPSRQLTVQDDSNSRRPSAVDQEIVEQGYSRGGTSRPSSRTDMVEAEMVDVAPPRVPGSCSKFEALRIRPDYDIFDINFYEGDGMKENLKHYYDFCADPSIGLSVTTSCFPTWKKSKKHNCTGKIIPAVPSRMEGTRVFFFDDNINLNLGGGAEVEGICNLRDIETAEYVDFSEGKNGFAMENLFRYTVVHSSSEYNCVLVQANILDAMTNHDYFQGIISKYSKPGERFIVFVDVNGTTVADDTITIKDVKEVLMATMFMFTDIRPWPDACPFQFDWPGKPSVSLEKVYNLRSVVNMIANKDEAFYKAFWTVQNCEDFIKKVCSCADLVRHGEEAKMGPADFFTDFQKNYVEIQNSPMIDGIPQSWLKCYACLAEGGHHVIMNSFGVDTHRVIKQIAPDAKQVIQLTVNYKLWSERDTKMWTKQFGLE